MSDGPTASSIPDDEDTPGLAGERTDLAWSRSGFAVIITVAAILKYFFALESDTAPTIVFILLIAGAVAWALALTHARALARTTLTGRTLADEVKLRYVAVGTGILGLGALVIALIPPA
jgi:uncharacterized membrane protein YidH (DUF202 family)